MPLPKSFEFSKYSGCGNDFILINNLDGRFKLSNLHWVSSVCHRYKGIGADGVIFLNPSLIADFQMRIFNADGGEAEMCGNGLRCLLRFLQKLTFSDQEYNIETQSGILRGGYENDLVYVRMPLPHHVEWSVDLSEHGTWHFVNTGVPHAVYFTEDLECKEFSTRAAMVRHHPRFAPHGANVNLAMIQGSEIEIRTYERGVEAETQACGTGAAAVAYAARYLLGWSDKISIRTRLGDRLLYQLTDKEIVMCGPAEPIFDGIINLKQSPELE